MEQSYDIEDKLRKLLRNANSSEHNQPDTEELISLRDQVLKICEGAALAAGIFNEYLVNHNQCSRVVNTEFANVVRQAKATVLPIDILRKYAEIRWDEKQAEHIITRQQKSARLKVISKTAMRMLQACVVRLEFKDFVRLANHVLLARHSAAWGGNTQIASIKTKPSLQQEELQKIVDYHAAKGAEIKYHGKIIGSDALDSEVSQWTNERNTAVLEQQYRLCFDAYGMLVWKPSSARADSSISSLARSLEGSTTPSTPQVACGVLSPPATSPVTPPHNRTPTSSIMSPVSDCDTVVGESESPVKGQYLQFEAPMAPSPPETVDLDLTDDNEFSSSASSMPSTPVDNSKGNDFVLYLFKDISESCQPGNAIVTQGSPADPPFNLPVELASRVAPSIVESCSTPIHELRGAQVRVQEWSFTASDVVGPSISGVRHRWVNPSDVDQMIKNKVFEHGANVNMEQFQQALLEARPIVDVSIVRGAKAVPPSWLNDILSRLRECGDARVQVTYEDSIATHVAAKDVAAQIQTLSQPMIAVNVGESSNSLPPHMSQPRFDLLRSLLRQQFSRRALGKDQVEPMVVEVEREVNECLSFDQLETPGVFTGPCLDVLGITHIEVLSGRLILTTVPARRNTVVFRAVARRGTLWEPSGVQQSVILTQGDSVYIPAGTVHSRLVVETCHVAVQVVWDQQDIVQSLASLRDLDVSDLLSVTCPGISTHLPSLVEGLLNRIASENRTCSSPLFEEEDISDEVGMALCVLRRIKKSFPSMRTGGRQNDRAYLD